MRTALIFVQLLIILSLIGRRIHCLSTVDVPDSMEELYDDVFLTNRTKAHNEKPQSQNAQRMNRNFERMIQLVNILGQVDTFLSERTKSILRKLALLAEDDVNYYRKRRS